MELHKIPSYEINKKNWDACIAKHENGLIYSTTDYLDAMADNWTGFVFGDYEAVMPIVWRKKFGIKYCYNIPFVQQLGFVGKQDEIKNIDIKKLLLTAVKYGDYNFNFFHQNLQGIHIKLFCNYILPLNNYNYIYKNYSSDLINNLKKSSAQNLIYSNGDLDKALNIYYELYKSRTPHVTNNDFKKFRELCKLLQPAGKSFCKQITNANNETLAIAVFLQDDKRIYNMANSTTEAGRKTGANHFLFDNMIREFSEKKRILDFEGSDIPGIKSFYQKFGAINQSYYSWHFNRLPFPLNMLKQ